jgi:uncharacterized protein YuzE
MFERGSRGSEGNRTMKVTYDPEVDVLRIVFNNETIEESETIKAGVILDYDKDGNVVGMEMLYASKQIGRSSINGIHNRWLDSFLDHETSKCRFG